MNQHINTWMAENDITPAHVTQTSGRERFHGAEEEPVVITSVWHDEKP